MIRSAVIGVGYLGKFHAEKYTRIPGVELVAVVDQSPDTARRVAERMGHIRYESDYTSLLGEIDAVSIVVPTHSHYSIAKDFLLNGAHVLLEKPMASTLKQAQELIDISLSSSRILQVGHLERFNPAILAMEEFIREPMFIESRRLAPFQSRGTEVNVVHDLMIHDIDLILNMVKSEIESIDTTGRKVLSNDIDIANARIQFHNGCVANVTASRVSEKTERKLSIYQKDACLMADLNERYLKIFKYKINKESPRMINTEYCFEKSDTLMLEIEHFIQCITNNLTPKVTGMDGMRALQTATKITRLLH